MGARKHTKLQPEYMHNDVDIKNLIDVLKIMQNLYDDESSPKIF